MSGQLPVAPELVALLQTHDEALLAGRRGDALPRLPDVNDSPVFSSLDTPCPRLTYGEPHCNTDPCVSASTRPQNQADRAVPGHRWIFALQWIHAHTRNSALAQELTTRHSRFLELVGPLGACRVLTHRMIFCGFGQCSRSNCRRFTVINVGCIAQSGLVAACQTGQRGLCAASCHSFRTYPPGCTQSEYRRNIRVTMPATRLGDSNSCQRYCCLATVHLTQVTAVVGATRTNVSLVGSTKTVPRE